MKDEILLIGYQTQLYLHTIVNEMQRCGFLCYTSSQETTVGRGRLFTLTIDNYVELHREISCRCCELEQTVSGAELLVYRELLKDVKHIIAVIPIKLFASYRYNVDEALAEISTWITPDVLQRVIHGSIQRTEATLSWVIIGADEVVQTLTERSPVSVFPPICTAQNISDLQGTANDAAKRFFSESEESWFRCFRNEGESVSFGFIPNHQESKIGEKACTLWNIYTFLNAIQDIPTLESIFAHF